LPLTPAWPAACGWRIKNSRVFVCDNLAFNADVVIKRKHTVNGKHDLPGLIGAVIEPLALVHVKDGGQAIIGNYGWVGRGQPIDKTSRLTTHTPVH
jgi:hypothetical protein